MLFFIFYTLFIQSGEKGKLKMKKYITRFALICLVVVVIAFASACNRNTNPDDGQQGNTGETGQLGNTGNTGNQGNTGPTVIPDIIDGLPIGMDPASLNLPRLERPEQFTFRDLNSFPAHWNPHGRLDSNVQITSMRDYLNLRFTMIYAPNEPGNTFDIMNVAATNHTDITSTFRDRARFDIPDDITNGLVYTIDIREDLKWNDGTAINAHDWERSMKHLLNPEMQNPSAAGWADVFRGGAAYLAGEGAWEDVGVFASGDYQLTFVLTNWTNMFDFRNGIHGEWIVHEEMYTAGFSYEGDLLVTNYNSTVETSRFAGAFQITVAELDRQVVMERNPYWFGWTDPAFDDFYMMTKIIIDVIPEQATRMMLFNQGLLDRVQIGADDFDTYRFSERMVQWETTNLFRYVFNTDREMLAQLEQSMGDGFNRQVLSLRDFRRGLSFAIDRTRLALLGTAGHNPSVVLMENYYYDFTNNPNSRFRDTDHAMRAIVELYDFEYGPGTSFPTLEDAYYAITGYNVHRARELLQSAYEEAVELGIYTPGQQINIQLVITGGALNPIHIRQNDLLREMFVDAAIGTGFEGNLDITLLGNFPGAHEALLEGRIEARNAAWGGSIFSPIGLMGVYTNSVQMGGLQNINESAGWDPSKDTLTLSYDWLGTGVVTQRTKTFEEWQMSISGTGEFVADELLDTRVFILANLEKGVLATYQTIPHTIQVISILQSYKIEFIPGYYHPMFDDLPGPRPQIRFNFTDEAWAEFVASQDSTLNYE
jgi:ABC-type transport system substrate-binding protein